MDSTFPLTQLPLERVQCEECDPFFPEIPVLQPITLKVRQLNPEAWK